MKHLKIKYSNGAIWGIPLHNIADDRAKYYAEKDPDTTYQQEYNFVMNDDYEGWDWFANNMNWSDIASVAYEIKPPAPFKPEDHMSDDGTEVDVVL